MKKNNNTYYIVGGIVLVGFVLLWLGRSPGGEAQPIENPSELPGLQIGLEPWPPEIDRLAARLREIGLPALKEEGFAIHIHQHLNIFVHGSPVAVPAGAGINEQANFISALHTHDTRGVIHVESPTITTFSLGQFFDIWGVRFTKDCLGGYCNDEANTLKVFVNGTEYKENPRNLELDAHQEIVVAYGTEAELPNPIPSSYTFQAGE